ncbi:TcaA second domain-containing protein [Halobacillus andaensis]|uniref:TcaA second domain-containing protein n=1 Tax=Halobacillus andaensis TaxID=1176239 RepID=UPI003D760BBF
MGDCQKCGKSTNDPQPYCENCQPKQDTKQPADFAKSSEWLEASNFYEEYQEVQKSYKKRNWKKIFASLVTLLLFLGFGVTGWFYLTKITSANHTVQEFERAVKNEEADRLAQLVTFNHADSDFNKSQAADMIQYFNEHTDRFASTIAYLRASAEGADEEKDQLLHVTNVGDRLVLFDHYKLTLEPEHLNIETSQENVSLYIDGDKVGEMTEGVYKVQGVTPGEHVVKGEVEVNGEQYDQMMSVNTYESREEPVALEFDELSPEAAEADLRETLDDDIKQAVEQHIQEYIKAYETKDVTAFTVMKNDSYIEDTEQSIEEMEDSGKSFFGEIKNITYDDGSIEFRHHEENELFTSSIIVSFLLDTGYYLNGDDAEDVLSSESTYSWEYELSYDQEARRWVISSGTPMAMFETDELDVKEYN